MLHRAILGSLERFLGVLIEHYAGAFPLWLAPVQAVVATITSDADDFAGKAAAALRKAGLRVETDLRNEKVGYKVREHSLAKVPVIAVVGRREAEEGKVALRRLGSTGQEVMTLDEAVARWPRKRRRRICGDGLPPLHGEGGRASDRVGRLGRVNVVRVQRRTPPPDRFAVFPPHEGEGWSTPPPPAAPRPPRPRRSAPPARLPG